MLWKRKSSSSSHFHKKTPNATLQPPPIYTSFHPHTQEKRMDNSSLAIFGGVVVGLGLCVTDYYQLHSQKYCNLPQKFSSPNPDPELKVMRSSCFSFILWSQDELYSRVKSYFGEEKFKDLENSFVIVRVAFLCRSHLPLRWWELVVLEVMPQICSFDLE
jgi:hypothetical protein